MAGKKTPLRDEPASPSPGQAGRRNVTSQESPPPPPPPPPPPASKGPGKVTPLVVSLPLIPRSGPPLKVTKRKAQPEPAKPPVKRAATVPVRQVPLPPTTGTVPAQILPYPEFPARGESVDARINRVIAEETAKEMSAQQAAAPAAPPPDGLAAPGVAGSGLVSIPGQFMAGRSVVPGLAPLFPAAVAGATAITGAAAASPVVAHHTAAPASTSCCGAPAAPSPAATAGH